MLATGGSAAAAIALFADLGVKDIHLVSFLAAPEGIKHVHSKFPRVKITVSAIDECLNEHVFATLSEVRRIVGAWRIDYNTVRPHGRLGRLPPAGFGATRRPG